MYRFIKTITVFWLLPIITFAQDTLIVDNTDAGCTVEGGWNTSVRDKPFNGTNYLYGPKGDGSNKIVWEADIKDEGIYSVFVWWCASGISSPGHRAADAPYTVAHQYGKDTIFVNQADLDHSNQWFKLGEFAFPSGQPAKVTLTNDAGNELSADAAMFVLKRPSSANVLFFEDFNKYPDGPLPDNWWYEGSNKVQVKNGRLRTNANTKGGGADYSCSTVWMNKKFSGNLKVEFDAHVLSGNNNMNFFLLYSCLSEKPLNETRGLRVDARYKHYHVLNGYIITFIGNRIRLRDCPGFNLIKEVNDNSVDSGSGTQHITITRVGNRITYNVNGKDCLSFEDNVQNPEHQEDLIGFRTWQTDLWWDNLKVTALDGTGN
jgi:hypothetical protein